MRTHFKAATSVARGDACCLNFNKSKFGDQFAEIARNLNHITTKSQNNLMSKHISEFAHVPKSTSTGSRIKISQWMKERTNSPMSENGAEGSMAAKANQFNKLVQIKNNSAFSIGSQPTQEEDSPQGHTAILAEQDWSNLTDDQKAALIAFNKSDVDPKAVTEDVLKMCNVFRVRQNVHGESHFMRKRTGTGGCGGRKLSPEHAAKLGTYGFGKADRLNNRKSEGAIFGKSGYNAHIMRPQTMINFEGIKNSHKKSV